MFSVTISGSCPVPTNLSSTVSTNGALLSWIKLPEHLGFQLRGRRLGDPFFGTVTTAADSRVIGALTPSTNYEWKIRAKCLDNSISAFSPLDTFATLAIREQAAMDRFSLSPNPASQIVELSWMGMGEGCLLQIFDMIGQEQFVARVGDADFLQLDIRDWAAGVYRIALTGTGGIQTKSLIVE